MKKLSIIICTYNRSSFLLGCVQEVIEQVELCSETDKKLIELIIVDNNSSDRTPEIIRNLSENNDWILPVRELKQGLSHARNRGAVAACGEYLCYLDDDARPSASYIKNVLQVLNTKNPDIMGGPVYPVYTTKKPFWFSDSLETRCHSDATGFTNCLISGGNYIIRKELLFKLGMFSSDYGMIGDTIRLGEERELLERYKRAMLGGQSRIYYSHECSVLHHVPEYKMSLCYFVRRAYQSGKMLVKINAVKGANEAFMKRSANNKKFIIDILQRIFQKNEVNIFLRALHQCAKITGIGVQCILNKMSNRKSSNVSA